jgi:Tfp pilus assembly protein PilO
MPRLSLPHLGKLAQEPLLREKVLFAVTLATLFIFFFNYVIAPESKALSLLRGDLKGVEAEKESVQHLIEATEAQLKKEYQSRFQTMKLDAGVARVLNRRIADPAEEITTTVELLRSRKIARRVDVRDVSIGNVMKVGSFDAVPITVQLTGAFSPIRGYIAALEHIDRPVVVKSFDIKSDKQGSGQLEAKLALYLYLMKKGG